MNFWSKTVNLNNLLNFSEIAGNPDQLIVSEIELGDLWAQSVLKILTILFCIESSVKVLKGLKNFSRDVSVLIRLLLGLF